MNPNTGEIVEVKDDDEAREKGLVPIPAEELERVRKMDARRRRRWARKMLEKEAKASGVNLDLSELYPAPVEDDLAEVEWARWARSPRMAFNRYVDGAERNAVKRLRKIRLKPKPLRKCR